MASEIRCHWKVSNDIRQKQVCKLLLQFLNVRASPTILFETESAQGKVYVALAVIINSVITNTVEPICGRQDGNFNVCTEICW